jgi:glucose/arabinose dehydrogenase
MVGRAAATLLCLALPGVLLAACLPAGDDVAPAQAEPGPSPAVADASVVEAGADGPPPPAGELLLPLGMEGIRWAEGLARPVAIAFGPDGWLFVAEHAG